MSVRIHIVGILGWLCTEDGVAKGTLRGRMLDEEEQEQEQEKEEEEKTRCILKLVPPGTSKKEKKKNR